MKTPIKCKRIISGHSIRSIQFDYMPFMITVITLITITRPILVSAVVSKCCPIDSQILVSYGSLPNCVKRENSSATWDSYNVKMSDVETQFPRCAVGVIPIVSRISANASTVNGCLDKSNDDNLYSISCKGQPTIALHKLNKCCPVKHNYDHSKSVCVPSNTSHLMFGDNVVVLEWKVPQCSANEDLVEFQSLVTNVGFVDQHLRVTNEYFPDGEELRTNKYCIESNFIVENRAKGAQIIIWICQPKNISDRMPFIIERHMNNDEHLVKQGTPRCQTVLNSYEKHKFYSIALLTSCAFLLMTLIVYLSMPKLLNLHGKTLLCYIFSVFCAFCVLILVNSYSNYLLSYCFEMAVLLIFCILSAFCWQTVISVDLWLGFRSLQLSSLTRQQTSRRLMYYILYGWGVPLMWISFIFLVSKYEFVPAEFVPRLNEPPCYFTKRLHSNVFYLYAFWPYMLHVALSIGIFIVASVHCSRIQRIIHQVHFKPSKRKEFIALKAVYTTKLQVIVIMGISWILEIVNIYFVNESFKIMIDLYNISRGFMIFYIFVYKRPVIHEFKRRIGCGTKVNPTAKTISLDTLDMKDESNVDGRSASDRKNAAKSRSSSSTE